MIKIRYGIFETNSSSTHSLIITTNEEFEKLKKNEFFIDDDKIITKEEVINIILKSVEDEDFARQVTSFFVNELDMASPQLTKEGFNSLSIEVLDSFLKEFDFGIKSYEAFINDEYLETFEKKYTTEHGDKLVIFGNYGNQY